MQSRKQASGSQGWSALQSLSLRPSSPVAPSKATKLRPKSYKYEHPFTIVRRVMGALEGDCAIAGVEEGER